MIDAGCAPPTHAQRPASVAAIIGEESQVARAPDEARPEDHGLEAPAGCLLDQPLGLPSSPNRGPASRGEAAVSSAFMSGSPARIAASVPQWTNRSTPAAAQASSALRVPSTLRGGSSSRSPPLRPTCGEVEGHLAALGPGGHRGDVVKVAADGLGAERRDRRRGAIGARQRADVAPPATRRRMSAPPMKPEPPVTKADPGIRSERGAASREPVLVLYSRLTGQSTTGRGED